MDDNMKNHIHNGITWQSSGTTYTGGTTWISDRTTDKVGTTYRVGGTGDNLTLSPLDYNKTHVYPAYTLDNTDFWPKVDDAIGIVFIKNDEIKLMKKNGEEIVIGRLDDSDDFTPLEVVVVKMKLTEEEDDK